MAAPVHAMLMHMGTASFQALARSCCFQLERLSVVQGVYPANINLLHGHYSEGNSATSPKHNRGHPPLAAAYASEAANATEEVSPFRRASQAEQGAAAAEVPQSSTALCAGPQPDSSEDKGWCRAGLKDLVCVVHCIAAACIFVSLLLQHCISLWRLQCRHPCVVHLCSRDGLCSSSMCGQFSHSIFFSHVLQSWGGA